MLMTGGRMPCKRAEARRNRDGSAQSGPAGAGVLGPLGPRGSQSVEIAASWLAWCLLGLVETPNRNSQKAGGFMNSQTLPLQPTQSAGPRPQPNVTWEAGGATHAGQKRQVNEDSFLV